MRQRNKSIPYDSTYDPNQRQQLLSTAGFAGDIALGVVTMPARIFISLLLAIPLNFASANEVTALPKEEIACRKLIKKIPKNLSQARKLAPLLQEVTAPDLDYCHENLNRCDLRTFVFDGFSLSLLHEKASHRVAFHVARFSNLKKLREFCGKECVAGADYDEKTRQYVIDCQKNI